MIGDYRCSTGLLSRYHAFDNSKKDGDENTQVPELMEKVEEMITDNQGQTAIHCLFVVLSFTLYSNPIVFFVHSYFCLSFVCILISFFSF